jgi:hypothetical protein
MRYLNGIITLFLIGGFISYAQKCGMVVSNDVVLLCMTIAFASGVAGGD